MTFNFINLYFTVSRIAILLFMGLVFCQCAFAQTTASLSCAAFYPNIGQSKLFFRIIDDDPIDPQGLTLMQDGNLITSVDVQQIGSTTEMVSVLKVTVTDQVTNRSDIEVMYQARPDDTAQRAQCVANLTADSDSDGLVDIVDSSPFDAAITTTDTSVAAVTRLAMAPEQSATFYSRDVVIRSLLSADTFDYIEEVAPENLVKKTFTTTMTPAMYFGISAANARVFRVDASCQAMLDAARDLHLTKVRIAAHCVDVSDDFANEPVGSQRYTWAEVTDQLLVASAYRSFDINVLPEINISGQSSYLYDQPTTTTIAISAYVGSSTKSVMVTMRSRSEMVEVELASAAQLPTLGDARGLINGFYRATSAHRHPAVGSRVTRWLVGTEPVWQPSSGTMTVQAGGYPEWSEMRYAIGTDNYVEVTVADAAMVRINEMFLYDVSGASAQRVLSMVGGRFYYVVADIETNITDIADHTLVSSQLVDGYHIITTITSVVNELRAADHLVDAEYIEVIVLQTDATETTHTVTVGWDRIGSVSNVVETYLVTPTPPIHYDVADNDGDRIPNRYDVYPDSRQTLQVVIADTIMKEVDALRSSGLQPLFLSDIGLIAAIGEGGDERTDYSAANNVYDDFSDATQALLDLDDAQGTIESIATYGVNSVDYALGSDGKLIGGIAQVVFPIEAAEGNILYLGKYNKGARRWENFGRGDIAGYMDSWYAIERVNGTACSGDLQKYKNEHRIAGENGMGFVASTQNCIMLVISDGGPYDDNSLDGRVVALSSLSAKPFSVDRVFPSHPIITVVAKNDRQAVINIQNSPYITYSMSFEVSASEAAHGLMESDSYGLLRIPEDGMETTVSALANVASLSGKPNTVIVSYTNVRLTLAELGETSGFTLARNGTSLQGVNAQDPIRDNINEAIAPGTRLDSDSEAIANTAPYISVIDDFRLVPTNQAYSLPIIVTDNAGSNLKVSVVSDNSDVVSTTPVSINIASDGISIVKTVHFDLIPAKEGRASLTIHASDGITTSTRLFEIEVGNSAPVIEGIEAEQTMNIYAYISYPVNFTVYDADIGLAKNEDVTVEIIEKLFGGTIFVSYEGNLIDGYSLIISGGKISSGTVTILVTDSAGAKTESVLTVNISAVPFVQGRLRRAKESTLDPSAGQGCIACDPTLDGIVHLRFTPDGTKIINEDGEYSIEFSLEMRNRKIHGDTSSHFVGVAVPLLYNNVGFGDRLNDPSLGGILSSPSEDRQCDYRHESPNVFEGKSYNELFIDLTNNMLAIFQISNAVNIGALIGGEADPYEGVMPEDTGILHPDWRQVLTMTCNIPANRADNEAGIALSDYSGGQNIFILNNPRLSHTGDRIAFSLADNDLRGFRLDGKTYARDYARYGDGLGVRLEFSKGIATQLTTQHFAVYPNVYFSNSIPQDEWTTKHLIVGLLAFHPNFIAADDLSSQHFVIHSVGENEGITIPVISEVIHTPNSRYAHILFSEPVRDAELRLVSTDTTIIEDTDGNTLADGNFVAAPEYDAKAPQATTMTQVSYAAGYATWHIGFNAPLEAATVATENLCLSSEDGVCVTTPTIVSAALVDDTTIAMVVDEVGSKVGDVYSVEFERNAVLGSDFRIVEDYQGVLRNAVRATHRPGIGCAAFYPNIGQNELFFRVTYEATINISGLTLMQDGNPLVAQVEQIGDSREQVSLLKATLNDALSDSTVIDVRYKPRADTADEAAYTAQCVADLTMDSDGDEVVDIADSAPFDGAIATVNTRVASPEPLAAAPEQSDAFYSRDVVIRSLLAAETFDYIQQVAPDTLVKKTVTTAMTPAMYFGINDENARVFRVGEACQAVLDVARNFHLTKVQIAEHCVDVSDSFADEAIGSQRYTWAEVADGLLVASAYRSFDVEVLAEINILGQSSYLYDQPTTTTIAISAYVGNSTERVVVMMRGVSETAAIELSSAAQLPALGDARGLINGFYRATSAGRHPPVGGSVTRWLAGSGQVWQPSSGTMTVQVGGYPEWSEMRYAIGNDNYIEVAVAAAAMVRINDMFLYDVSGVSAQRVLSMVGGRLYYVVVDIETNITDIANHTSVSSQLVDGYNIITTFTSVVSELRDAGHLIDAEYIEAIVLQADVTETTRTLQVGWDRIGNIVDIHGTYLLTPTLPSNYAVTDYDGDRIPDRYDVYPTNRRTLQVVIADTITREVDALKSSELKPLFLSDVGLIMALSQGGDESTDYSATHRVSDDLSDVTRTLLNLDNTQSAIGRVATYGVNSVDYAMGHDGELVGGVAQVVFPMATADGSILYLGGYNRATQRWEQLERVDNSWYAIERAANTACPSDIQKYNREHHLVSEDGLGFVASAQNCIMLVINDGSVYDASSLDGRVIGLSGISVAPFLLSSTLYIADLSDFGLVANDTAYTIPIEITAQEGRTVRVSIMSDDSAVVSTTPTTMTFIGNERGTNQVDFELTPNEVGNAMVTVYAMDGVTTASKTFAVVVVANTAPAISGLAVDETVDVLVGRSATLDFAVRDADLERVPNEHINVAVQTKYNGLATLRLATQPQYHYRLTITGEAEGNDELTITATDNSGVSTEHKVAVRVLTEPSTTEFVQSRFAGAPTPTRCAACRVTEDGIARIRFDLNTVQQLQIDDKHYIEFALQLRKVAGIGNSASYLSSVAMGLHYAAAAFGNELNVPAITADGSGGSQCSYMRAAMFTDTGKPYNLSFRDAPVGGLHGNELIIAERNSYYDNLDPVMAAASSFSVLDEGWSDVINLRCEIPSERMANEARLVFSGKQARAIMIRKYPALGDAVQRPVFLLADNDLRGLRLDGKTYVRDYARYGDGFGVRLEFSNGIATQLTTQHFAIHRAGDHKGMTLPLMSEVAHTPNSHYAYILFSEPMRDAMMRLVSTDTTIIEDIDGNTLADDNFVAALEYDAKAPQATTMTQISYAAGYATWHIGFNAPLAAAAVAAENLCLSSEDGVCVTTPTIVSAALVDDTTIAMVVDEVGSKVGDVYSVEFERNAVLGSDFRIVEDYQGVLRNAVRATHRPGIGCAAFYPNIGQNELFFRVTYEATINISGLTLMQDGNPLVAQVEQIGDSREQVSLLKATLNDALSDSTVIDVRYKPRADTADEAAYTAQCVADLTMDSDGDEVVDIADSAPFDGAIATVNTRVASPEPLAAAPEQSDAFYSRDVVIRSLLAAETFDYIQQVAPDTLVKKTVTTAMTPAMYFGINDENARVFRVGEACQAVLDVARNFHLTKVQIAEHCVDVSDSFADEAIGSQRYTWAEVADGLLVASAYRSFDVEVLAEINILGQSSYLYDQPTTTTIAISAYVGNSTERVVVMMRGVSETAAIELSSAAQLPALGDARGLINGFYRATSAGRHPPVGGSVTRWLAGSEQVWQPSSGTMTVQAGGYPEWSEMRYAIGNDNYIEVAVAAAAMVRINDMFLYDVSGVSAQRVLSMVGGRLYYVVVDIETNIADIANHTSVSSQLVDGYNIITTFTSVVSELRDAGHLIDAEYIEAIVLQADVTETTRTLQVGWDRIGNIVDIHGTYLLTPTLPSNYAVTDYDGDRIPDRYDVYPTNRRTLQVVIADTIAREVDALKSSELKPLFLSDVGLIMALNQGSDESTDYSATHRVSDDLSDVTRTLLNLDNTQSAIGRVATYGVNSVDYAIGHDGELVGGVAQVVFPMATADGSILYLGGYNRATQRWEQLERVDNSWYAIERAANAACPSDIQKYKREHRVGGEDGLGFVASAQNCIMLVINDGSVYDASSLDGRVIGLSGISAAPFLLSSTLYIADLSDLKLVANNTAYTIPIEITAQEGRTVRVSIMSDDSAAISTTPTTKTFIGDERGTNQVDFELIANEMGNAMVTVYAMDGVTTASKTFAVVVVANTAPAISGLAVDETVDVLVGRSATLDFAVRDADLERVPNEHINVAVQTKYNGLATLRLAAQPQYHYRLTIIGEAEGNDELTITATDSSGVSTEHKVAVRVLTEPSTTEFVQSRFAGAPTPTLCAACRVTEDGIARIRFDLNTVQQLQIDDKHYIEFALQLRKVAGIGNSVSYLSSVAMGLHYAAAAFGDELNAPAITADGSGGSQCSYMRAAMFTDTGKPYNLSFRDAPVGGLHGNELIIAERNSYYDNLDPVMAAASSFSVLDEGWSDVINLRCEIPSERMANEARLVFSGKQARAIMIRKYPALGDAVQRPIFLLADNDLRGLRLDGKTYVRDYARYGNGRGVRLEFSNGIATQLTTQHFAIHRVGDHKGMTLPLMSEVAHTPNSHYAYILFSEPMRDAMMRLVSTNTTIIEDIDGNPLADDNFVAALEYDAKAPQATTMTQVSYAAGYATWHIGFNAPLAAATVATENLCLSSEDGVCVTTPTIVSAALVDDTTIAMVVDEFGSKVGGVYSVELERNGVLGSDFRIVEDYQNILRSSVRTTNRFGIECAAFYPNIGQNVLFLRVTDEVAANTSGLTLMQDGNPLMAQVEQIGAYTREISLLKATLNDAISDSTVIDVRYKSRADTADEVTYTAQCVADLIMDSDGDEVVDIADSAPFDGAIATVNTRVASAEPLAAAPEQSDTFYSRDVVIRSLLAAETFDYIQQVAPDTLVKKTVTTAMTPAMYFGINAENVRVFRVDEGCQAVLDVARDFHLTKVQIAEHCVDVSDGFADEAIGSQRYTWAEVADGLLVASAYRSFDVEVLPEINILGQSSYLYDQPTTTTIAISAYVGNSTERVVVMMRGVSETAAIELSSAAQLPALGDARGLINGFYRATSAGRHPPVGGSVTRWLAGSGQVWQPSSGTMTVQVGGYPEWSEMRYAIGNDNYIEVAVADAAMVRINDMFLYDVSGVSAQRVLSMVGGRLYYVVVDIETNITDIANHTSVSSQLVDGYNIITTFTSVVSELRDAGHLIDAEYIEAIVLQADVTETTRTLQVGWDRIGNIVDIHGTYLLTPTLPSDYAVTDYDGDRIPDRYDVYPTNRRTLQVVIADTIAREVDALKSSELKPLFLSDVGLIMALNQGSDESTDYSATHRVSDDLSDVTRTLLNLDNTQSAIGRVATYGVNSVDYAMGHDGELVGGVAQVVFPMATADGSILYLGGYNRATQRWEQLERVDNSWYAIERAANTACPSDIQKYKREHRVGGEDGLGFVASAQNCIMLVINDGSVYDASSLDGRVIGLNGISVEPFLLSSTLYIADLSDLKLVANNTAYTIPIEITAQEGRTVRVSIMSDDSAAISTTPTTKTFIGDERGTNQVDFELIANEMGNAMVTVYAMDGVTTASKTFEIMVVANTAPAISGLAVDETVDVLVGRSATLDFAVRDADLERVPNEHINVAVQTKYNGLATLRLATQPQYHYRLTITGEAEGNDELTITATDNSGVSTEHKVAVRVLTEPSTTEFVQSRFAGAPTPTRCAACRVTEDGIARIRFDLNTMQQLQIDDKHYIEFALQLRKVAGIGNSASYLSSVAMGLHYAAAAFGDELNAPAITADGSGGSQCSYMRAAMFTDTGKPYNLSFRDAPVGGLHGNELIIAERNSYYDNLDPVMAAASSFSVLDEGWSYVINLRCEIPSERMANEARLVFSGKQARAIMIRKYPALGDAVQRPIFLLADNDLRGLRLDGKTYVRDYARYGDGRGVRLEFSNGIATQLTTQHFAIHRAGDHEGITLPVISEVTHTPNSRYAHVLFSEPMQDAMMRLVSTDTTIIEDIDGNTLADDSFVAALEYDAEAPRVISFTEDETFVSPNGQYQSRWMIGFNAPIYADTLRAENLCLTDITKTCSSESPATPSIRSIVRQSETMASVVINDGSEVSSISSLEFRRNAVLGNNFKVVEEYQGLLRDKIAIKDTMPPTITVVAENNGKAVITEQSHTHINYDMNFTVASSEPVVGLDAPSSYLLLRIPKDRESQTIQSTPVVVQIVVGTEPVFVADLPTVTPVPNQENMIQIEYTNVRMEVTMVKEMEGFTLGRMNAGVMDDMSGNNPVGMLEALDSSEPLDSKGVHSGRATAETSVPSANARLIDLLLSDGELSPTFSSATTIYETVIPNATTSITVTPTVDHIGARIIVNGTEVSSGMPSEPIVIDKGVSTNIEVIVIAQDGTSQPYTVKVTRSSAAIRIRVKVFLEGATK